MALRSRILVCLLPAALAMAQQHLSGTPHWTYKGALDEKHWGAVKEWEACAKGKQQSPVDIHKAGKRTDLTPLQFDYSSTPERIVNNGHTIQVNYGPGSTLKAGDKTYRLVQFHFHEPAEDMIDSNRQAMEVHLVHQSEDGKLAVVAVFLKVGAEDPLINKLWSAMPAEPEHENDPQGVQINARDLLPHDRSYYTFQGSLTTPPCTEGVTWFVLETPVEVSKEQVAAFGRLYPNNARHVQRLNGRDIGEKK